jgi:hypothetical protein
LFAQRREDGWIAVNSHTVRSFQLHRIELGQAGLVAKYGSTTGCTGLPWN